MLMKKVHMNKGPIFNSFGENYVWLQKWYETLWTALSWPTFWVRYASRGQLILGNPLSNLQNHGLAFGLYSGLPDWAISRELGYPRVLIATDFESWRFATFWIATRYLTSEFWWTTNCVVFCLSFCLAKDLLIVIFRISDMVPEFTFSFYRQYNFNIL